MNHFFPKLVTDPVNVDEYAYQPVYSNFKELTSMETRSRVKCGADCLSFTQRHHCTAFLIDDSYVCHCGVLSPFVTGPPHVTNMYVKLLCRQSNITGNVI